MFENFFGKIKKFFKKGDLEKKRSNSSDKAQSWSNEQSDETLGNVSGGQGDMQPDSHKSK